MTSHPLNVTLDLLDALLSPTDRASAELMYHSLPLISRASSILSILISFPPQCNTNTGRIMLASVLLRRDIATMGGTIDNSVHLSEKKSYAKLLTEMVDPMMDLFGKANDGTRRFLGHVVAEICLSLSVLDESNENLSEKVIREIIDRIGPGCIATDISSLRLLSTLCQRCPLTLGQINDVSALQSLIQSAVTSISADSKLAVIEALLDVICQVGTASVIALKVASPNCSITKNEMLLQMVRAQIEQEVNPKTVLIDPHSPSAKLGQTCLPSILQFLHICSKKGCGNDEDLLSKSLEHLVSIASMCPSLLVGDLTVLTHLIHTCLALAQSQLIREDMTRLTALQVMASLTNIHDVKKIMSKNTHLLSFCLVGDKTDTGNVGIVQTCTELIVKGIDEDVESWALDAATLQDDANSWENDDIALYAESLLELFIRNLGGGCNSFPVILPLVDLLLSNDQWQSQWTAMSILKHCSLAAPFTFASHIPVAMETAIKLCYHSCVRVQFQAIELLGVLCQTDSIEDDKSSATICVRKKLGGKILESLSVLTSSQCTKVSSHACLAMVSYCRGGNGMADAGNTIDVAILLPYLKDIIVALANGALSLDMTPGKVVNSGSLTVMIRAVSAVACLAETAGSDFLPFYGSIMPGLLGCAYYGLERAQDGRLTCTATNHDLVILRGDSLQAATIVGQAVGDKNLFTPDAEKIMTIILPILKDAAEKDEESSIIIPLDIISSSAARVASIMGDLFLPFLPSLLSYLLKKLNKHTDVSVSDCDATTPQEEEKYGCSEYDEDTGLESVTVAMPGMGIKKLVLDTIQIQEKADAARVIYTLANAMGAWFGPYVTGCFDSLFPLIHFKYSSDVRSTVAQALGQIFNSSCEYALTKDANLSDASIPIKVFYKMVLAIAQQMEVEEEDDIETLFAQVDAMSEMCHSSYENTREVDGSFIAQFHFEEAKTFVVELIKSVKSCINRRSVILNQEKNFQDNDENAEYEQLLSREAEILTELVNCIGYTIKMLKQDFATIFDEYVAPLFGSILIQSRTNDVRARLAALCIFADCVEHGGPITVARYAPMLVDGVREGIDDSFNGGDMELKQVAVYSIIQIARQAPPSTLASIVGPLLKNLLEIAGQFKPKDEIEDLCLVEYASSAIATLVLFSNSPFSKENGIDKHQITNVFLSNLPLQEDENEAKICHKGFCEMIDSGDVDVVSNSPQILNIFSCISASLSNGDILATPETCGQIAKTLNKMQLMGINESGQVLGTLLPFIP